MNNNAIKNTLLSSTGIISFFLLLSGTAALIYQVVWVRLLSLSIGSTSISISTVLAAFFLGLGIGSYYADSLLKKFKNALKIYLVIELFIAVSALVLLPVLLNLDSYMSMLPMVNTHISWRFFMVMLLLLVPTFLIGTTFPLLMAVCIRNNDNIRSKLAHFYAFNTIGSVLGALLSGIVLIPHLGLDGTVYVAALLNLGIVLTGWLVYNRFQDSIIQLHQHSTHRHTTTPSLHSKAFIVLFVTGLSAMATEVGWMKFLIVYTGNTIYGFSLILAMFLFGLALGSWLATSRRMAQIATDRLLFYGLLLLAFMLLFARVGLGLFPEMYVALNAWDLNTFVNRWSKYLLMLLLLLPATIVFGALFPIALNYYSHHTQNASSYIGTAYSINIIAGIVGSLLAGFVIIPYLSTDFLLTIMALLIFLSALLFVKKIKTRNVMTLWIGYLFTFMLVSYYLPHLNYRDMVNIVIERHAMSQSPATTNFITEGQTGIISTLSYRNAPCIVKILNNGMNESWVDICDPNHLLLNEFLLGVMPLLLNPDAQNAFVVGYGGGTTLKALTLASSLHTIDVVELEPAILDAVRSIYNGVLPTQQHNEVHITVNDARNSLLMSSRLYDIIVSQPSHPWLSGASNMMNKDFFSIVKSKLSDHGINGQWVPLFTLDVATLKSIIKAYTDTFEYVISFINISSRDFLMFGSKKPIVLNLERITSQIQQRRLKPVFAQHRIASSEDLMRYFALNKEQLVNLSISAEPATDSNMLAETFFSRYRGIEGNSFNTIDFLMQHSSHDFNAYVTPK